MIDYASAQEPYPRQAHAYYPFGTCHHLTIAILRIAAADVSRHCLQSLAEHPRVVTLRDSTTVEELVSWLPSLRRIVLVGNGGIALELVHALKGLQVRQGLCTYQLESVKLSCAGILV